MISSTTNATTATSAAGSALNAGASNQLINDIQDRFLTLLITQLKHQDPLNPLENAEVTSQLAQISTVNGITQLNQTLLALSGQLDMTQAMQAASLVGKSVLVPGDKIALGNGVATPFGIDVVAPAANVEVSIVDGSGLPVRTMKLGPQDVGVVRLEWDGMNDAGQPVPDGAYYVRVTALDANESEIPAGALTYARVGGVAYTANGLQLNLGLAGNVSLYDIRMIL